MELESHRIIISELKDNITDKREDGALIKQKLQIAESDATNALIALEKVSFYYQDLNCNLFAKC